jgi:hypothetical protein
VILETRSHVVAVASAGFQVVLEVVAAIGDDFYTSPSCILQFQLQKSRLSIAFSADNRYSSGRYWVLLTDSRLLT